MKDILIHVINRGAEILLTLSVWVYGFCAFVFVDEMAYCILICVTLGYAATLIYEDICNNNEVRDSATSAQFKRRSRRSKPVVGV